MSKELSLNDSFIKLLESERKRIKGRNESLKRAIKKIDKQTILRENSYNREINY